MFRNLILPENVPGKLYLHSMPGRFEPLKLFEGEVKEKGIRRVVCLATPDEVRRKSPDYFRLLEQKDFPWTQTCFSIEDFGVPQDRLSFRSLVESIAADLSNGASILLHCGAGIGRTGLTAASVLIALGEPVEKALDDVRQAGSQPERAEQLELITWLAGQMASDRRHNLEGT